MLGAVGAKVLVLLTRGDVFVCHHCCSSLGFSKIIEAFADYQHFCGIFIGLNLFGT